MKELIDKYDRSKPVVKSIRNGVLEAQLIGSGAESRVWRAEVEQGIFAIKIPIGVSPRGRRQNIPALIERRAQTALKAIGIQGVEQIEAASPYEGASIYRYVPGISMQEMTPDDADSVSDSQLEAFLECVERASLEGIVFDGWNNSGENAVFNSVDGITLLDYWSQDKKINTNKNIVYALRSLGGVGVALASRIDESLVIAIDRER